MNDSSHATLEMIQIARMNDQVQREDLALVVLKINLYDPWSLFFKRDTAPHFCVRDA